MDEPVDRGRISGVARLVALGWECLVGIQRLSIHHGQTGWGARIGRGNDSRISGIDSIALRLRELWKGDGRGEAS